MVKCLSTWYCHRDIESRVFSKITKPITAHLHEKGILCSIYIDDLYIQGSSFEDCAWKVQYASSLLKSLGFDISAKSTLTPTQKLHHLGFVLNSANMTVTLSPDRIEQVQQILRKSLL